MLNKELLKLTMDLIKARPSEHNQATWVSTNENNVCGTTMCFAGHAAVLAGAEIPDPKKHEVHDWYVGKGGKYLNWRQAGQVGDESYESVASFARGALGLSYEESDFLFDSERDVEELEEAVDKLLNDLPILDYDDDDDDWEDCECCGY